MDLLPMATPLLFTPISQLGPPALCYASWFSLIFIHLWWFLTLNFTSDFILLMSPPEKKQINITNITPLLTAVPSSFNGKTKLTAIQGPLSGFRTLNSNHQVQSGLAQSRPKEWLWDLARVLQSQPDLGIDDWHAHKTGQCLAVSIVLFQQWQ